MCNFYVQLVSPMRATGWWRLPVSASVAIAAIGVMAAVAALVAIAVTAVIISPIVIVVACGICILFFVFCRRRRKDERDDTGNYAADDAEQVKEKGEPVSWIGYINDTGIKEVG